MNTKIVGFVLVAVFVAVGLGMLTPPKAAANGTGNVLLGVGAGLLLYNLFDNDRDNDRYYHRYNHDNDYRLYRDRDDRRRWDLDDNRDRWHSWDGRR